MVIKVLMARRNILKEAWPYRERPGKIKTTRGLDKPLGKIRAAKEVAWTGFIV